MTVHVLQSNWSTTSYSCTMHNSVYVTACDPFHLWGEGHAMTDYMQGSKFILGCHKIWDTELPPPPTCVNVLSMHMSSSVMHALCM